MLKDLVVIRKNYKSKKGEDKVDLQFYLVLDNGKRIRIAPYFCTVEGKEWNTFSELNLIARDITDEK